MQETIVEYAPFAVKQGVGLDDLLAASLTLQVDFLEKQAGFLSRDLVSDGERKYADIIRWADKASFEAAMEKAATHPACAVYFGLLDMSADHAMKVMPVVASYQRA